MGVGGAGLFRKSTTISAVLRAFELRVFLTAPGHQMANLGGLIPTRDEPTESGFVRELQEFDSYVVTLTWYLSLLLGHSHMVSVTLTWSLSHGIRHSYLVTLTFRF